MSLRFTVAVVGNMALPFFVNFIFVAKLGAGTYSDLLFLAVSASSLIVLVFTSGVHNFLLSKLVKLEQHSLICEELSSLLCLYMLIAFVCCFSFFLICIFIGFDWKYVQLVFFAILIAVFTTGVSVFNSYFYAVGRPLVWELVVGVGNVLALLGAWLVDAEPYKAYVLFLCIMLLKVFCSFIFFCISVGVVPWCSIEKAWHQLLNLKTMVGLSVYSKSESFIDRLILSSTPSLITYFHIGSQIYNTLSIVWGKLITSPLISSCASQKDDFYVRAAFVQRFGWAICCGVIIIVASILAWCVWSLLPLPGLSDFNVDEYLRVIMLLSLYGALQLVGHIVAAFFYVKGDYSIVPKVAAINFTVFLPLKVVVFYSMGFEEFLAITALYHLINIVVNMVVQYKLYGFTYATN